MLDRLIELQNVIQFIAQVADENNIAQEVPKEPVRIVDTDEDIFEEEETAIPVNEDLIAGFMNKVGEVEKNIQLIEAFNDKINELTSQRFNVNEEDKGNVEISNLINRGDMAREDIKRVLDEMAKDIEETTKKLGDKAKDSPELRAKNQMISSLRLKFKEVLKNTNSIQLEYKKNAQNKIKRQLKIVKPDLNDEELEELSKDADAGKKLISEMVMGPHTTLKAAVSDIKKKYEEILKLERSVMQVHKLFEDLAMLVHDQILMMDNIEHNLKSANNYLEKSEKRLERAKKWHESTRLV